MASNQIVYWINDRYVHQKISFNIGVTFKRIDFKRIDVAERMWEITSMFRAAYSRLSLIHI